MCVGRGGEGEGVEGESSLIVAIQYHALLQLNMFDASGSKFSSLDHPKRGLQVNNQSHQHFHLVFNKIIQGLDKVLNLQCFQHTSPAA